VFSVGGGGGCAHAAPSPVFPDLLKPRGSCPLPRTWSPVAAHPARATSPTSAPAWLVGPFGTAVLSGTVTSESPYSPSTWTVGWSAPYDGATVGGETTTIPGGLYSLTGLPAANAAGLVWAQSANYEGSFTAVGRYAATWSDPGPTVFDFDLRRSFAVLTRGGPWADWTNPTIALDGQDARSGIFSETIAHDSSGLTDLETYFPAMPGLYDTNAVYFWANEGVEVPSLRVLPYRDAYGAVEFADVSCGWALGSGTLNSGDPITYTYNLIRTTDSGASWTQSTATAPSYLYDIDFCDTLHGWITGSSGTLLATTDGGVNWSAQDTGLTSTLRADFVDPSHGWVTSAGGAILRTTDGGAHWEAQTSGTTEDLRGVDFIDAEKGWAVGGDTILSTTDGGATWDPRSPGATSAGLRSVSFGDSLHGCAGGKAIVVTTDGGDTWTQSSGHDGVMTVIALAMGDALHGVAVGTGDRVEVTDDGGLTWTTTHGQDSSSPFAFLTSVAFAGTDHVWACGEGSFMDSYDAGKHWSGDQIAANEADAQRFGLLKPASGSGKPGTPATVQMQHVPSGWTVQFSGYPGYPATAPVQAIKTVAASGLENQNVALTIPRTAKPGYFYIIGLRHQGGPLYLETAFQVSTLKASRTRVAPGGSLKFSGIVPTQGHWGNTAGKRKYVYLFKSTRSATKGFKGVRRYRTDGYGKFVTSLQKPTRTAWWVVVYPGDGWYWEATTPTVKVTVR